MRKGKHHVTLSPAELRLVAQAMINFRNKLLEKGIDTVDVDRSILKLYGKK